MQLLEGIQSRHSIGKLKADPVDHPSIETMIAAAITAPNHHVNEPWRFFVLEGAAVHELGDVMAKVLQREKPAATEADLQKERSKPLRAPVIIAVTSDEGKDPTETTENLFAVAAAVENLLLAAHHLGLAAQWRTGSAASAPELKEWLGVPLSTTIVALVYLGHADMEPKDRRRGDPKEKTVWRS